LPATGASGQRVARGRSRLGRLAAGAAFASAALACTAFFIWRELPEGAVAGRLASALSQLARRPVGIEQAGLVFDGSGPALRARGVAIDAPGSALRFDSLLLRPIPGLTWLAGEPELRAELAGDAGRADLLLRAARELGLRGELSQVDLSLAALFAPELALSGRGDLRLALEDVSRLPRGRVELDARDGSFSAPGLPLAIPYQTLRLRAELGSARELLRLEQCRLVGPLLRAEVEGGIGAGMSLATAPLDLRIRLEVEASLREAFASAGIALGPDGSARLRVTGSAALPQVR